MISIIIPFYNRYDLVMRRMADLHSHLNKFPRDQIEILMVNNGSDPAKISEENIYFWQKMVNWFQVRYLKWEKNIGFGGAMNRGAKAAKGEYLCFLSDDVIVNGDFITEILSILKDDPTALVGGEVIWWAAGWNEFEIDGKKTVVPYANGWMLACSKSTFEQSGGFDPVYYPYDYEDVDLSTRWIEMGYNIKALSNKFLLNHIGGATISGIDPERASRTQLHRQKYIAKWAEKLPNLTSGVSKDDRNDRQ